MITLAPSLLSADFRRLDQQVREVEKGGVDWLHLDIMDGHFVPNISFGPMIVKTVRKLTKLPLDTHLMISEPDRYLEAFRDAGTDWLTVHVEACPHLHRTVQKIRSLGMKAGVTLNPATPLGAIEEIVPSVDLVLIMSVNPGFGGQKFIAGSLEKIQRMATYISSLRKDIRLEVDGGIDDTNAGAVVRAGADVLVAGNSIFSRRNIPAAVRKIRKAAGG